MGVDITGVKAMPNGSGIHAEDHPDLWIYGNQISGSRNEAVFLATPGPLVVANYIGTTFNGSDPIPNGQGIVLDSTTTDARHREHRLRRSQHHRLQPGHGRDQSRRAQHDPRQLHLFQRRDSASTTRRSA